VTGRLYAVQCIDGDLADGVDLTLTAEHGELSIPLLIKADWNSDQMIYPRVPCAAIADGSALTWYDLPLVNGKPKAVLAQGGDTKTGAIVLYIQDI
jgi:hypothetical protein